MKNDKNSKNVKNKISFKATLSQKNLKPLKPERINIQTLIKPKNNTSNFNKQIKIKQFFEPNELYLKDRNNDSSFNSIKNSFNNINKRIFTSDSLNNSFKSTYTSKKRKYKRNKKCKRKYIFKNNHKISNSIESINNIYMESLNNINSKLKNNFLRYSTSFSISNKSRNKSNYSNYSSSSNNDNSDSSETSYNSIEEFKKQTYYSKMILDEKELENLTKKEIGIISSDDEEENNVNSEENNEKYYNNSSIMNNLLQENYSEEIEHILIDIYNKNISIINSQNLDSPIPKKSFETSTIDKKKMKKIFKKQYDEKNLLVLKILSDKIKCLIEKCKEKIYEIDDIKKIHEQYIRENNQRYCNSIGSSGLTTNSNSYSYHGNGSDDDNYFIRNNLLLNNIQDESFCKEISYDLLSQLINIKNTLKISSKEIENIFKYAFNSLKTNDGKKAKINIELVQLEQFNKVILNDDIISTLLIQIKLVFKKHKEDYIVQIIEQLQQECRLHKDSMTKFDNLLCQNLGITNEENEKNNIINENKNEFEIDNEKIYNNKILNEKILDNSKYDNEIIDSQEINNNLFNLANISSNEEENIEEENNIINEEKNKDEENNNNENNEINENNNIINNNEDINQINNQNYNEKINDNINEIIIDKNNQNNNENINFENIDDLVKFINEDGEGKGSNKKHKKKNKKKKKKKDSIEEEKINNLENYINIKNSSINAYINNEFDDDIIKNFKEDIIKNSIYNYNITKIKPKLPINYLLDKFYD